MITRNRLIIFLLLFITLLFLALLYDTRQEEIEIAISEVLIRSNKEQAELTERGIMNYTNKERERAKLNLLLERDALNQIAELRVRDMIEKEYFNHLSQKEFEKIAEKADYNFLLLGENIAQGGFLNDQQLVEAWMKSPTHRENILNKDYQEIGVAIEQETIVQVFGKPKKNSFFRNQYFLANIAFRENFNNFLTIFDR